MTGLSSVQMSDNFMSNIFFPSCSTQRNLLLVSSFKLVILTSVQPESEFNEFEPRLKFAKKNRFQLSAGLNLETLNTILGETNDI